MQSFWQSLWLIPTLTNWICIFLLVNVQSNDVRFDERLEHSEHLDPNPNNPKVVSALVIALERNTEMKQRSWYPCCLPKTSHCSMASVVHTVACIFIFSFSFTYQGAKVNPHERTSVALPDSLLCLLLLAFRALHCVWIDILKCGFLVSTALQSATGQIPIFKAGPSKK